MEKEILNKFNEQMVNDTINIINKHYDKNFIELQKNYTNFKKEISDILRHEKKPEDVLNSEEFNYVIKNHAKLILSFCKGIIEGKKTAKKMIEEHGNYNSDEIDEVINTDVIDDINDCLENEINILFENVGFENRFCEE